MRSNQISVLIPTLNEEKNLERCLRAVSWSDDIVVFDSYSSDRTEEIARDYGARFIQRRFDNEAPHRLASLRVPFKHKWIFNPDADEVATPELCTEMFRAVADAEGTCIAAFRMRRKDMFQGKWLRYSSLYPTWVARLYRPDTISFERSINLTYCIAGEESFLNEHLIHYTFEKGLDDWFDKHNRYSRAEAIETLRFLAGDKVPLSSLLSSDPLLRRKAMKELSMRLPFRPLFRFLYMYIARRGFLDGVPGFHYSCLIAFYEYMIILKAQEIVEQQKQLLSRADPNSTERDGTRQVPQQVKR